MKIIVSSVSLLALTLLFQNCGDFSSVGGKSQFGTFATSKLSNGDSLEIKPTNAIKGSLAQKMYYAIREDFNGDGVKDALICDRANKTVKINNGTNNNQLGSWKLPRLTKMHHNEAVELSLTGCEVAEIVEGHPSIILSTLYHSPTAGARVPARQHIIYNDGDTFKLKGLTAKHKGKDTHLISAARSVKCSKYPQKLVNKGYRPGALCFYSGYDSPIHGGYGTFTYLLKLDQNSNGGLAAIDITDSSNLMWYGGAKGTPMESFPSVDIGTKNNKYDGLHMMDAAFLDHNNDGLQDLITVAQHASIRLSSMKMDTNKEEGISFDTEKIHQADTDNETEFLRVQAFHEMDKSIDSKCVYVTGEFPNVKDHIRCYESGQWKQYSLPNNFSSMTQRAAIKKANGKIYLRASDHTNGGKKDYVITSMLETDYASGDPESTDNSNSGNRGVASSSPSSSSPATSSQPKTPASKPTPAPKPKSPTVNKGPVLGSFNISKLSNGDTEVKGWTCLKNHNSSIPVHIYLNDNTNKDLQLKADDKTESAVNKACDTKTSVNHRFRKVISSKHGGESIKIYGISPDKKASNNKLLLGSKTYKVYAQPVTNKKPEPAKRPASTPKKPEPPKKTPAPKKPVVKKGPVTGSFNISKLSNGNTEVKGWACLKNHNSSIPVHIYLNDNTNKDLQLKADDKTESAVNKACGTNGSVNHRFRKVISSKHGGESIKIYGISPDKKASSNKLLKGSKVYKVYNKPKPKKPEPKRSTATKKTTKPKKKTESKKSEPAKKTSKPKKSKPTGPVIGSFRTKKNGNYTLVKGWACLKGLSKSIDVHIYLGGKYAAKRKTKHKTEQAVYDKCKTSGTTHRFEINISNKKYGGKSIKVYGISPNKSLSNNKLLSGSKRYKVNK